MTNEEKHAMERYGITSEEKTIFYFEGYKYDRLSDAVNYAKTVKTSSNPESGKFQE